MIRFPSQSYPIWSYSLYQCLGTLPIVFRISSSSEVSPSAYSSVVSLVPLVVGFVSEFELEALDSVADINFLFFD